MVEFEGNLLSRRLQRQRTTTAGSRAHVWNATITSRLVLRRKVGKIGTRRAASNDEVLSRAKWTLLNVSDLGTGYLVGTEKMFHQQPGMSGWKTQCPCDQIEGNQFVTHPHNAISQRDSN